VRNTLMGRPITDVDLATTALPDETVRRAQAAGFRAVPTGIEHGTVTVIVEGRPFEVTTLREDVETDGRRAVVAFGRDFSHDAMRRDFTINALFACADGTIRDHVGGLADIAARRVRFIGDPDTRIREDYLRILRFFRFHACYGDPAGGLDPEGLAACAALSTGLETISRERITAEMRKLLAAKDPAPSVAAMAASGVLAQILPGSDHRALAPLIHLEGDTPPRWLRRLAVLGGADTEAALRLSRPEARHLGSLVAALSSLDSPAALGWQLGADLATDAILARAATLGAPPPPAWQAEVTRGATATFPVTAADLMPSLAGAALGDRLKQLQAQWLATGLRLTRDDLLNS
jgi:poly(A) polymerase